MTGQNKNIYIIYDEFIENIKKTKKINKNERKNDRNELER